MNFLFAENLGIGINLSILERSSQRHSILFYQHGGVLFADNTRIGNTHNVDNQFALFFEKARIGNCDLALTPEYSCPFTTIENIISHSEYWPAEGKLWTIGCESMTKAQLSYIQETYNSDGVFIYYNNDIHNINGNFVDPLIYIFIGEHTGQQKLIVLIQFKTHHMSVWSGAVERDNLIQGNEILILRNAADSINLFSIICSEAMNFSDELNQAKQTEIGWIDRPFLILNPQLNPDPSHLTFIAFRKFVFRFTKKEIIAVNWNNSTTYHNHPFLGFNTSRSGFYIQSDEINLANQRIKNNHTHGLYYFNFGIKKHAFLLNSTPVVYSVSTPPVDIANAVAQQIRREGPEVIEAYRFNDAQDGFEVINAVTDMHFAYLLETGCNCNFLTSHDNCILEKEKLVCLTSGKLNKELGANWSSILNVFSLKLSDDSEINRRITFAEDTYPESLLQRSNYIDTIAELLNTILPDKSLYPESISNLKKEDLVIGYNAASQNDNYKFNILTATGEKRIATICFIGSMPDGTIKKTFDSLQGMFDNDNNNKRRVVVFYRRGNSILSKSDPEAGDILTTGDFDGPTYLK